MRICDLEPGDVDDVLDLAVRAFGDMPTQAVARRRRLVGNRIAERRYLGVRDAGRLVAAAGIIEMRQYWYGNAVPLAGVTSVMVAPEDRGRGIGPDLTNALLERCAEHGWPLSLLYPATRRMYRAIGYELAGRLDTYTFPSNVLRIAPTDAGRAGLRRIGAADAPDVVAAFDRVHRAARDCGPTVRPPVELREWLAVDGVFAYLADDGFLMYSWQDGSHAIDVRYLLAGSEPTLRTLWGVVASHGTVAERVQVSLGPDDPVFWLARDPAIARESFRWMSRIVDLPAAIAARGFPPGTRAEALLTVDDPVLAANAGTWRLTVADGAGHVERVDGPHGSDAARLGVGALAALYAGVPTRTLRLTGLLEGGASADVGLDAAFGCRAFTLDRF